jgi:alpha-tubulin suppressor-like RCC1 family protein
VKYLLSFLLLCLPACSDVVAPKSDQPVTPVLTSIEIFPGPQEIGIGDFVRYRAVAFDNTGQEMTGVPITWTTSNPSVIRIDSIGHATAIGPGSADVIAAAPNGVKQTATIIVRAPPVVVPLDSAFVSIVVFGQQKCALSTAGRVFCARNSDPFTHVPVPAPLVSISARADYICGLDANGNAYCWGMTDPSRPGDTSPRLTAGGPFVQVAVGNTHACGLTAGGVAHCWGSGINGRHEISNRPTDIKFVRIAAGDRYNCGITVERDIACWGGADHSAFFGTAQGDSRCSASAFHTEPCSTVPVRIPGTANAVELAVGGQQHCYLDNAGKVNCWGVLGPGANCTYGGKYGGNCLFTPYRINDPRVLHGMVSGTVLDDRGSLLFVRPVIFSDGTTQPFRLEEPQPAVRFVAASGGNCGITVAKQIHCW